MGYSRFTSLLSALGAILLLTGCTGSNRETQIGSYPITFPGEYEKDYTIESQAAVQLDGEERRGTMIQTTHEGIRDEEKRQTYLQSVTYPGYSLSGPKEITSDCNIPYIRYHASLVSDPITEQRHYLSYVFLTIPPQNQTTTVSYLTLDKSNRSTRDNARAETLGCIPES